jgi:hypothetical protein
MTAAFSVVTAVLSVVDVLKIEGYELGSASSKGAGTFRLENG